MSCILKIQEALPTLTNSEKKIAKYILENKETALKDSTQLLAEKIKTSPATIVRFSKSLGYSGLPELKIALAKDSQRDSQDLTETLIEKDSIETLIKKTFNHRYNNLERLTEILNIEHLEKATALIKKARCVYLVGIGASGIVCSDFYHKLTRIGKLTVFTNDNHTQLASLNGMSKEDVLVAISYSGETKEVILSAKIANKKKTPVIGITQMSKNTLTKLSQLLCYVPNCERYLRIGAISSRDASMYITDLLYLALALNDLKDTKTKLKQSREWVSEL